MWWPGVTAPSAVQPDWGGLGQTGEMPELADRRRLAAAAGHTGDVDTARAALSDAEPGVRSLGYGALERIGALTFADLLAGLTDEDSVVVRRVISCAARVLGPLDPDGQTIDSRLLEHLSGPDDAVAEAAAWALGERHQPHDDPVSGTSRATDCSAVVTALSATVIGHKDALVRESAVAALGAIGEAAGLQAILQACTDKATVRRRAVLALASFDGPAVQAALQTARTDRDWQVRQAAEDLLSFSAETTSPQT
jgi:HEAT repeat protein